MKRTISILGLSLLLGALLLTGVERLSAVETPARPTQLPTGARLTLAVPGMTCDSCESRIRSALEAHPGVQDVAVDLRSLTVEVMYDPTAADPKALADRVTWSGYPARYLPAGARGPAAPSSAGGCGGGCCGAKG